MAEKKKTTTVSGKAAEEAFRRVKTMKSQEGSSTTNLFVGKPKPEPKSTPAPKPTPSLTPETKPVTEGMTEKKKTTNASEKAVEEIYRRARRRMDSVAVNTTQPVVHQPAPKPMPNSTSASTPTPSSTSAPNSTAEQTKKTTTTVFGKAAERAFRQAKAMGTESPKDANPFTSSSDSNFAPKPVSNDSAPKPTSGTPAPSPVSNDTKDMAPIRKNHFPKPKPNSPYGESHGTTGRSSSSAGTPTPGQLKRKAVRATTGALGVRLLRQSMSIGRQISSQTTLDQGTSRVIQTTVTTAAPIVTTARAANALLIATATTAYVKHIQDMYKGESVLTEAGLTGNRINISHLLSHLSTKQIKDLEDQIPDHVKNLSGSKDLLHRHPHMTAGQKIIFSSVTGGGDHVSDFEVHVVDLTHDAGKMKEASKAFKKANGGFFATRKMFTGKTYRQMRRMVRQARLGSHAAKVLKRYPLSLGRSVLHAAIQPLQNSEVMRGAQLGTSSLRVGRLGIRHVVKPIIHIAYNHGARIYNAIRAMQVLSNMNLSKGEMVKGFLRVTGSQILRRIPVIGSKVYVPSNFYKDFAAKAADMAKAADKSTLFAKRIKLTDLHKNPILRKIFVQNLMPDEMNMKGKTFFKKETRQMQKKVLKALRPNTLRDRARRKVGRATKKVTKKVGKALLKPFKTIGKAAAKAIGKAAQAVVEAIVSNPFVLIIVAIILILCMLVQALLPMIGGSEEEKNIRTGNQLFSLSTDDSKLFRKHAELILKQAKSCHDDMEKDLDAMMKQYPTADVQYPNGEEENYKEIWCAVSIMAQSNINDFSESDLKEMTKTVYNNTHKITHTDYDYTDADGTKHTASHIFVNIARGSDLCYEAMSGQYRQPDGGDGGDGGSSAGNAALKASMTVPNDDWLQIVQNMKAQIASFQAGYSQSNWLNITVNGQPMSVRTDCSGFVGACLNVYGSVSGSIGSSTLRSMTSMPKFVKFNCSISGNSGWDSLQAGDILVSDHHTEIFSHSEGNKHYVWNCGGDSSCNNPGLTNDPGNDNHYIYVWRPIAAGTSTVSASGEIKTADTGNTSTQGPTSDPIKSSGTSGSGQVNTKPEDDEPYPDLDDMELPMSNMPTLNEDTGNEDGYEDLLMQDAKHTKKTTKTFVNGHFYGTSGATLIKKGSDVSSSDFVRYIFAKHGVRFSMNNDIAVFEDGDMVSTKDLKKGDIIWYIPKTGVTNEIKKRAKGFARVTDHEDMDLTNKGYGKVDAYQTLLDTVVPLIYMGDGKCMGYCGDITRKTKDYEAVSMQASIQTFKVKDLSKTRIWNCERYSGFTKNAIYGSTNYFEGWTDTNIKLFLILFNDDCWNTGIKNIVDMDSDNEDSDKVDTKSIDFSWYSNGAYETDKKYNSDEKSRTFLNDVTGILKRRFTKDGLLPGTGYALANALSDNRTTEESLSGNDIFEMTKTTGKSSISTQRYTYKGSGAPDIKNWEFRSYGSMEEACTDYAGRIKSSVKLAVTTKEQLTQLYVTSAISRATLDKALSIYNSNKGTLDSADDLAIRRKEFVQKMTSFAPRANGYNSVSAANSSEAQRKADEYAGILKEYGDTKNALQSLIASDSTIGDGETSGMLKYYDDHISSWNSKLQEWKDLAARLKAQEEEARRRAEEEARKRAEAEAERQREEALRQQQEQMMQGTPQPAPVIPPSPSTPSRPSITTDPIKPHTGGSSGGSSKGKGKGGKKGGGKKKGGGIFGWLFG